MVGLSLDTKEMEGALYLNEPVVPVLVPAVTETINPVAEPDVNWPSTHAILEFVSLITGLEHAVDPILTDSAELDEPKPDPTTVTVTAPAVG